MSTTAKHQKIASISLVCLNERKQSMILSQTKLRDNITSKVSKTLQNIYLRKYISSKQFKINGVANQCHKLQNIIYQSLIETSK